MLPFTYRIKSDVFPLLFNFLAFYGFIVKGILQKQGIDVDAI